MSEEEKPNTPNEKALARAEQGLMPIEDQVIFDQLVKLNPEGLTDYQRKFLRARRGYLNHEQERIFDSVINEPLVEEESVKKEEPKKESTTKENQPSEALLKIATDLGVETKDLTADQLKEEIKKAEPAK